MVPGTFLERAKEAEAAAAQAAARKGRKSSEGCGLRGAGLVAGIAPLLPSAQLPAAILAREQKHPVWTT